jgi:hypothetical protein
VSRITSDLPSLPANDNKDNDFSGGDWAKMLGLSIIMPALYVLVWPLERLVFFRGRNDMELAREGIGNPRGERRLATFAALCWLLIVTSAVSGFWYGWWHPAMLATVAVYAILSAFFFEMQIMALLDWMRDKSLLIIATIAAPFSLMSNKESDSPYE